MTTTNTTTTSSLSELVDAKSLAIAAAALDKHPTVVLVEASAFVAELAAPWIIEQLLPTTQARLTDARVVAPEKANWTVEEITEQIIAPASLTPRLRNVIVVTDADKMTASAADHLLKAIEEPPAPTTFVLCAKSTDLLSATIRSRSSAKITFPLDHEALHARLVATGLTTDLVTTAIAKLGDGATVLDGLATHEELARDLVTLATKQPHTAMAASSATRALATIEAVAKAATAQPDEEDNEAGKKRRTRRLVLTVLDAWTTTMTTGAGASMNPDDVARRLGAIGLAHQVLERNGSLELALTLAQLHDH